MGHNGHKCDRVAEDLNIEKIYILLLAINIPFASKIFCF